MQANLIFWPVLTQVALTILGYIMLGIVKTRAVKTGNVDLEKTALNNDAWPDSVLKISNNIRNQFQVPVLFFVLSFIFYSLDAVSVPVLSLAWAFVITRVIHAYIHMSSNYVPARFSVFTLGFVIMVLLAILAAVTLRGG